MTRQEAIETAVRRHIGCMDPADRVLLWPKIAPLVLMTGVMTDEMARAIRAHFRAVCRQYGVRA